MLTVTVSEKQYSVGKIGFIQYDKGNKLDYACAYI